MVRSVILVRNTFFRDLVVSKNSSVASWLQRAVSCSHMSFYMNSSIQDTETTRFEQNEVYLLFPSLLDFSFFPYCCRD